MFEPCQAAIEVRAKFGLIERRVVAHQYGEDAFAEVVVRNADHGRFGDAVDRVEDEFDLFGVNVLAAADDHVAGPTLESDSTVGSHAGDVTGDEPAVVGVGGGGGFGTAPVLAHHLLASDGEDADLTSGEFAFILTDDFCVNSGEREAHRAG